MARQKRVTGGALKTLIAQLQASGNFADKSQLDLVLEIMNDKSYPARMRTDAAKAALPFFHQPKDPISDDDTDE